MDNEEKELPETLDDINVKYIRLTSGEAIVSYVHELEDDAYVGLEEPMKVIMDEDQTYLLTPYMPFSRGKVHVLDAYNILLESEVDSDIKAKYLKVVLDEIDPEPLDTNITRH